MRSFEDLLRDASAIHGHCCAGQVLGIRMAMVGCREVDIDEPKGCKKLLVYVEIDRCATDAIQSVTGCSLGKRSLKFLDYGKMAATFVNLETHKAVRVLAKDEARALASSYCADELRPREAQKKAYALMPEHELFVLQPNPIHPAEHEMPGFRGTRVICDECGEGVNFRREVIARGRTLCLPCARGSYLPDSVDKQESQPVAKFVHIVGYKKVGKTTLIEKLVPELSLRGYRVGTVKRHHSETAVETDSPGTDTWRHRKAGAVAVALVTPAEMAFFHDLEEPTSLAEVIPQLKGTDIVLVEGFHAEPGMKIEVLADRGPGRLSEADRDLIATVAPNARHAIAPSFDVDNVSALADLIEREVLRTPDRSFKPEKRFRPPSPSQVNFTVAMMKNGPSA